MQHKVSKANWTRTRVVLMVLLSTIMVCLMLFRVVPVQAQETASDTQYTPADDSRRQTETKAQPNSKENKPQVAAAQTGGALADRAAQIIESADDSDGTTANRVVVGNVNCDVGDGATITIRDADGTEITLTDGGNVDIEQGQGRIVIMGNGGDQNFRGVNISGGDFGPSDSTEMGTVVRSTGITCGRADSDKGDNGDKGRVKAVDNLLDLNCQELLQRSRDNIVGQYGNPFTNAAVEARIEVCLEQEVIDDTDTGDDLPDTGGLPLVGLVVLGIASIAAGASVIRGVGRGE